MSGQAQTLRKEHANCARLLDAMEYMTYYSDRFHHPREDFAFRRQQRKFPETRPLVEELTHQHGAIAAGGDYLVDQLTRAAEGVRLQRDAVEAGARAYIAALRANMRIEETDLFRLVA